MIKRVKIKYGIIGELIILFALVSYMFYENMDGSIGAFFPNSETKEYIKWVDFDVCSSAMGKAYEYDVESQKQDVKLNWIELLAYLGTRYGGDFSRYKEKDLNALVQKLQSKEESIGSLTEELKYYNYYYEAYSAVLGGFVGEYEIQVPKESSTEEKKENSTENNTEENTQEKVWVKKYGLKAFLPIAKYFPYSDYDDFGVSRSYGYKRRHLGHDMMGQTGTPVIAVESGYVEALGWNQYGGWRIGIRSFDGKRYYYYAHLRKNFPYNKSLAVGGIVQAGDVIGYLGRTGYSANENVNNIDTPHLHFGMQLIFDESQKEGYNEIWVDCYDIVKFLYRNRSETVKNMETKEWNRIYEIKDPAVDYYIKNKDKIKNTNIKHNTDESSPGEMKEENQGITPDNNSKEENQSNTPDNNSKEKNQGNTQENKNQDGN
ncbi:M23 family metallopeptidase [Anaerocolumna sp. MB42-C2]|nr:M23 family metallopeptidase [Anaerocolumna sp. MB42-C2]WMJ89393.1 M23 family metallopeptidase [Anaerocolumna sp. MB42-C2]